nr:glucagon receptor [Dromaius novaehollandiae]
MSLPSLLGLLLLLLRCQGPAAQITDFLFESWKAYSEECHRNMSRLPAPTELVCNRTFDKFSCWPDALPNTTVNVSCPWFLPWYRKVKHRHVFKTCGPDGQWVTGPSGQSLRNATQCQIDAEDLAAQERFARTYGSFKVMYTVGYSVSLCALILALAVLLGFSGDAAEITVHPGLQRPRRRHQHAHRVKSEPGSSLDVAPSPGYNPSEGTADKSAPYPAEAAREHTLWQVT